jgi:hypothetical protein
LAHVQVPPPASLGQAAAAVVPAEHGLRVWQHLLTAGPSAPVFSPDRDISVFLSHGPAEQDDIDRITIEMIKHRALVVPTGR